jgi:hypothetical protein
MPVRLTVLLSALAVVGAMACASTPQASEPPAPPAQPHSFVKRPAKPKGCAFDVFEAREPPRPYEVLGTLPVSANMWLGARGRKALLKDTACRAGADAVLLSTPSERTVGNTQVREYEAVFIAYTDVPATPAPEASAPPEVEPPAEGAVVVPIGEDLLGDTEGTMTRPVGPEDDAYWK